MMKKKSRGAALVLVICAMALMIALGTAALLAANSAFATSVDNASQQQAYLAACSYCEVLRSKLADSADPLSQRASGIADGASLTLSADATAAGDLGTAQCTLTRAGSTLTVSVDALYNGEHSMLSMRMKQVSSDWVFDSYLPVK